MQLSEMRDEVQAIFAERSDVTDAIADDYINANYRRLAMSFRFYELEQSTTFATVSGTDSYSVPTGCRETISLVDTTNRVKLTPKSVDWLEMQDRTSNSSSPPEFYVRFGSDYLLWPIPDGAYTVRVLYTKLPDELSADADEPVYPPEWHRAIVWLAASEIGFRFGLDTKAMNLKNEGLGVIKAIQEDPVMDRRNRNMQITLEKRRMSPRQGHYAEYAD